MRAYGLEGEGVSCRHTAPRFCTLELIQTLALAYRMHYMPGKPARQALLLAGFVELMSLYARLPVNRRQRQT